jgi:hypothetical protein
MMQSWGPMSEAGTQMMKTMFGPGIEAMTGASERGDAAAHDLRLVLRTAAAGDRGGRISGPMQVRRGTR